MRKRVIRGLIILAVIALDMRTCFLPGSPTPDSYAYVTTVDRDCHNDGGCYCDVWARLPRTKLQVRPAGPISPALMEGATQIHYHASDSGTICWDALHTWVDTFYRGGDRADAYIVLPAHGRFSARNILMLLIVALAVWFWPERKTTSAAGGSPTTDTPAS